MLMQPCDKEFFRMQPRNIFLLSALYQTELGKFFFVFQYMELSVPECEEEGLFYCDCTQYTGVSECYWGIDLNCSVTACRKRVFL